MPSLTFDGSALVVFAYRICGVENVMRHEKALIVSKVLRGAQTGQSAAVIDWADARGCVQGLTMEGVASEGFPYKGLKGTVV